jgi:hypothetical protein
MKMILMIPQAERIYRNRYLCGDDTDRTTLSKSKEESFFFIFEKGPLPGKDTLVAEETVSRLHLGYAIR